VSVLTSHGLFPALPRWNRASLGGPFEWPTSNYVGSLRPFGGRRKALGPKTLGGIRKCEDELGDKQQVGSERIAKGTAKSRQCNEYRRKTGLHLGRLAASDCEQRSWRSLGWDLAVALLALQALSAPSVGFVGPPQNDTTMPAQCSFPGGWPQRVGRGAIEMVFEGKKRPPPADREKKELWSLLLLPSEDFPWPLQSTCASSPRQTHRGRGSLENGCVKRIVSVLNCDLQGLRTQMLPKPLTRRQRRSGNRPWVKSRWPVDVRLGDVGVPDSLDLHCRQQLK